MFPSVFAAVACEDYWAAAGETFPLRKSADKVQEPNSTRERRLARQSKGLSVTFTALTPVGSRPRRLAVQAKAKQSTRLLVLPCPFLSVWEGEKKNTFHFIVFPPLISGVDVPTLDLVSAVDLWTL